MSATEYYTHINRQVIDSNRKHGRNEPPICFRKGRRGKATYAHSVSLSGKLVYSAHKPLLPCGARLVIVSKERPAVLA